jgi:hypothetical protein
MAFQPPVLVLASKARIHVQGNSNAPTTEVNDIAVVLLPCGLRQRLTHTSVKLLQVPVAGLIACKCKDGRELDGNSR